MTTTLVETSTTVGMILKQSTASPLYGQNPHHSLPNSPPNSPNTRSVTFDRNLSPITHTYESWKHYRIDCTTLYCNISSIKFNHPSPIPTLFHCSQSPIKPNPLNSRFLSIPWILPYFQNSNFRQTTNKCQNHLCRFFFVLLWHNISKKRCNCVNRQCRVFLTF